MKLFEGGNLEKLMESFKSLTNPVQNSSQPVADKTVADAQSPSPHDATQPSRDIQGQDHTTQEPDVENPPSETSSPDTDPQDIQPGDHVTPSQTPAPTPVEDQNLEPPLKTTQPSQGGRG
jgi:hypothetical protein